MSESSCGAALCTFTRSAFSFLWFRRDWLQQLLDGGAESGPNVPSREDEEEGPQRCCLPFRVWIHHVRVGEHGVSNVELVAVHADEEGKEHSHGHSESLVHYLCCDIHTGGLASGYEVVESSNLVAVHQDLDEPLEQAKLHQERVELLPGLVVSREGS
jgi:hypothetical protein